MSAAPPPLDPYLLLGAISALAVAVLLLLARKGRTPGPAFQLAGPDGKLLPAETIVRQLVDSFTDGRYENPLLLGKGGMAKIFRLRDRRLERDVAIKVMDPELAHDVDTRSRFIREARALAALEHPGLPAIHDVTEEPIPYFVMKFIEGRTLAEVFDHDGPATPEQARDWLMQAARALGHAHKAGIIHRDIKPENLMLDLSGRVYVIDFGIARVVAQAPITRVGTTMGTPDFVPPESLRGQPPSPRNDIYALAATGYYLLSGRPPYKVEQLVAAEDSEPEALPKRVDPHLQICLFAALAMKPEERPASMDELVQMLERRGG